MNSGYLNAEIIKAEKKRLEVFMGVLGVALIIAVLMQFLHYDILKDTFSNPVSFPLVIIVGLFLICLFAMARLWVINVSRKKQRIPRRYFWYTVIVEVLFPSAWLVVASEIEQTSALLDSPIIFIFFILIIVSSLHLDFWVSTTMGFLIALFIGIFTYWVTNRYPIDFNLPVLIYYVRAVLYFMSGLCAGFVAQELKRRLTVTYGHIKEKEEIEGLFNQQVSREIVEALKEKKDYSARLEVTILFLDIRDFTARVQHLSPEEVNRFQNEFFSPVIEIVNRNKGIVNQIMGDGLMATFGAPVSDDGHYLSAWKSVQEILAFLESFRQDNPDQAMINIGMGLHCGEVLVGNIGTDSRKQFSISGTPVIIASRIEQLNKELKSTLLMSKILYERLSDKIDTHESLGRIKMKGLDQELEIIKIL